MATDETTNTDDDSTERETVNTSVYVDVSETGRERLDITVDLTITAPVATHTSGFLHAATVIGDLAGKPGVDMTDWDYEQAEDRPEEGCAIPNLPDPEDEPEAFRDTIAALQDRYGMNDGHDPFPESGRDYTHPSED